MPCGEHCFLIGSIVGTNRRSKDQTVSVARTEGDKRVSTPGRFVGLSSFWLSARHWIVSTSFCATFETFIVSRYRNFTNSAWNAMAEVIVVEELCVVASK